MIWLRFSAVQLVMLVATVLGWLILFPFCLLHAWEPCTEAQEWSYRKIDRWKWKPLNYIYGNPEDGVSGQKAIVWKDGWPADYMLVPASWQSIRPLWVRRTLVYLLDCWRAYLWSGWRNSSDNLKYVFACSSCPLKTFTLFGRPGKLGWQDDHGHNVPVISWG